MTAAPTPFVTTPLTAPRYWARDTLWSVLVSAENSFGNFTMIEQLMPRDSSPPMHLHERAHEGFYLLEGEIRFQVEADLIDAGPGAAVWIPPQTPHCFRVMSDTCRALNLYTPGGFDDQFAYLFVPASERSLPPAGAQHDPRPSDNAAFRDRIRDLHIETTVDVPNLLFAP